MNNRKKFFSAAMALSFAVPAVTSVSAASYAQVESVDFKGMDAPDTIDKMVKPYSDASVEVTYSDGSTKTFPLSWKELFNTGESLINQNGEQIPASTPLDVNGNPIKYDGDGNNISDYYLSDAPDANSLLKPINGKLFMISHYESHAHADGSVPDSMTLTELKQQDDGSLEAIHVKPIDFSNVNGLWVPCNGSLSPWNTHLGSEEYEPDARAFAEDKGSDAYKDVSSFAEIYFGDKEKANPYYYGWTPEISVNANGDTKVEKHYSMGRFSKELVKMLPDQKTALFGDDGSNTVLFMYVADQKADLSAGTLYAAKFTQTSYKNGGSGSLEWVKLGHATDDEIKEIIDSGVTFHDIFDVSNEPKEGFTAVRTNSSGGTTEYLKLKPGMEKAAAFLESRRYAAYLGATSEFRKMEGVAVNSNDNKAYVAISEINKGMLAEPNITEVNDDIKFLQEDAGAVYELPLAPGQKDTNGNPIHSTYVPTSFDALIVGETLDQPDAYGNYHHVDKVSNPDNISYSSTMNAIIIGEDSGADEGHVNNFVWAYELDSAELERIASVPAGSEASGIQPVDDRNGFSYIMSSFQHPGDDVGDAPITAVNKEELVKALAESPTGIEDSGAIGYIHGLSLAPKETKSKPQVSRKQSFTNEPAPPSSDIVYTVKAGDWLSTIAKKYGVDWKKLAEYNQLENPDLILVGQQIRIPKK